MNTSEQKGRAYSDGFDTGRAWGDKWTPGGPYVPSDTTCRHYAERKRERDEWLAGWHDGISAILPAANNPPRVEPL